MMPPHKGPAMMLTAVVAAMKIAIIWPRRADGYQYVRYRTIPGKNPASKARRGERVLSLTRTEYAVLELFLRNPRRVLSRTAIFEAVWGYDFGPGSNALWVYISYLRSKMEAGGEARLIQTVRGLGYVLREEP